VDKGVKLYQLTKKELEVTDRLLDKASVIIEESQIPKAEQLLDQANDLQSKAQEMFAQNKFGQASKSSKKARDLVKKALEMVEKDITPLMVENAIQQNEKLIEKGNYQSSGDSRRYVVSDPFPTESPVMK